MGTYLLTLKMNCQIDAIAYIFHFWTNQDLQTGPLHILIEVTVPF
jgi:hypothetical protein